MLQISIRALGIGRAARLSRPSPERLRAGGLPSLSAAREHRSTGRRAMGLTLLTRISLVGPGGTVRPPAARGYLQESLDATAENVGEPNSPRAPDAYRPFAGAWPRRTPAPSPSWPLTERKPSATGRLRQLLRR
jgi:hypothetical protein